MNTLANKRLLIADDEDSNIYALRSYLETMNMDISVAANGEQVLAFLAGDNRPDVILLDMMMPVMDGYETLKALREMGYLDKIQVIAVTARAMKGDKEKCLEAGAWDYVSKPVDMNLLIDKLNELLQ